MNDRAEVIRRENLLSDIKWYSVSASSFVSQASQWEDLVVDRGHEIVSKTSLAPRMPACKRHRRCHFIKAYRTFYLVMLPLTGVAVSRTFDCLLCHLVRLIVSAYREYAFPEIQLDIFGTQLPLKSGQICAHEKANHSSLERQDVGLLGPERCHSGKDCRANHIAFSGRTEKGKPPPSGVSMNYYTWVPLLEILEVKDTSSSGEKAIP